MKILITGATGLIGTEAVKVLASAGHKVTATDRKAGEIPKGVKLLLGDLNEENFINSLRFNFDAVIHLAAVHKRVDESGFADFEHNVNSTYRLFSIAAINNVKAIVYASSLSIYGTAYSKRWTSPEFAPFDETLPLNQHDSYALCKEVNERTADMWSNRSRTAFVGLRLPFINTSKAIEDHAIAQRDGDLNQTEVAAKSLWGYLDVCDAANGLLAVLEGKSIGSKTYNFAAPDTTAPHPTKVMLAKFHPKTKVVRDIPGYSSLTDCSRWLAEYGYRPVKLLDREKLGIAKN